MADQANRGSADGARPPKEDGPSDRSLVRLIRHGSQEAATLLYRRYADRLIALARSRHPSDLGGRVDDDDIVQSVFVSFFRRVALGSYDVPAGQELWHLFLVITLNKIRAKGVYHRAARRDVRQTTGGDGIGEWLADVGSDDEAGGSVLRMSVDEELARLPEQHQKAIRLRMENYEVEEIARLLGRSKRSVERMLQEGRSRLAKLLFDD